MSRQRDRIQSAVESRGYGIEQLDYETPYNGGEMCGWCGGWTLILDRSPHPTNDYRDHYALSVDEMLAHIDYGLPPPEPCGCDREHSAMTAARLINDPERPTHGPECKWHIRYRLRWWKSVASSLTTEDGKQ